jgi:ribose/xylose/arabinose/galactoside ABC-type transport system permease subunit
MWQIAKGIAFQVTQGMTILQLPRSVAFFGTGAIAGVPVPIIIFVVVCVIAYFLLNHTSFGRSVYAVGGNTVSAWLSGIKVHLVQLSVFIVSGILATLGGLIYLGRTMCGSMLSAGGLELDSIAAVCIGGVSLFGGRGTIIGVIIGVIIISVINNGMVVFALDPALQNLVKGGVIIAAVAVDTVRRR